MRKTKTLLAGFGLLAATLAGCDSSNAKIVILKMIPCSESQAAKCTNVHPQDFVLKLQLKNGTSEVVCVDEQAYDRYRPNDKFDIKDEQACNQP